MSAKVLTNKERKLLENMGFNTTKIAHRLKRENDMTHSSRSRKSRYVAK